MDKTMPLLEKAIKLAAEAHAGKKDKAGKHYILHVLRVMLQMDTEEEMIAAVLHDVVEDTEWTLDGLLKEGFSEKVVEAIDHITKRESEEDHYEVFIQRVAENSMARKVKLSDLADNLDVRRLKTLTKDDHERLAKYHEAWLLLKKQEP